MKISHIVCTRNRAEQFSATLAKFNTALMNAHQVEFVLVDSESTDATPKVKAGDTPGKELPRTPDAGQQGAEMPSPKRSQGAKA
jgi:glycosyltransferase involved in cell wall biosynthesis